MGGTNFSPKTVHTDLATMLSVMQDLCPDDKVIVDCVKEMMNQGVIRRSPLKPHLSASV